MDRVASDVLVAYEMNGSPLRPGHGYPVRLVVPGYYGTNSVKWLNRLTLAETRAKGPFTTRWYNDPVRDELGRPTGATTRLVPSRPNPSSFHRHRIRPWRPEIPSKSGAGPGRTAVSMPSTSAPMASRAGCAPLSSDPPAGHGSASPQPGAPRIAARMNYALAHSQRTDARSQDRERAMRFIGSPSRSCDT